MMNIGFISTRFSGTDGVSLETSKWAHVYRRNGHPCFWFAGELDRPAAISYLAQEAHFTDKTNEAINSAVIGQRQRAPEVTEAIHDQRRLLKAHLYRFIQKFHIDILVAENVLSLPMQIPLGLALTEVMAETQIPTIAHHHDFTWERERFMVNAVGDYLQMAFPPRLPNVGHVVINSLAREEMARRTGIAATVVPNVLDFAHPPKIDMQAAKSFRQSIGLEPDDIMILQPTRVVQRKGIEHAVHLVGSLNRPNCKLVISHQAGDEGFEYATYLKEYARARQVEIIFAEVELGDPLGTDRRRYPQFSLDDIYPGADFVTYPSTCEGFGNALLEAIYFKKPLLTNRYPVLMSDIEPLGFKLVTMDGFLSGSAVEEVAELIDNPAKAAKITTHNYEIAQRHFAYENLTAQLNAVMTELMGDRFDRLAQHKTMPAPAKVMPIKVNLDERLENDVAWAKAYN